MRPSAAAVWCAARTAAARHRDWRVGRYERGLDRGRLVGRALFDGDGRVIGQVHGGGARVPSPRDDRLGKVAA